MSVEGPRGIDWNDFNGIEHLGTAGNLLVLVPLCSPTIASLSRFRRRVEELAQEGHAPALLICLAHGVMPDDDVRPALKDTVVRMVPLLGAVSVVVQGRGFVGAAQRAALTAVFSLPRLRNYRMHSDVETALRTLSSHLSVTLDVPQVTAQIAAVLRDAEAVAEGTYG